MGTIILTVVLAAELALAEGVTNLPVGVWSPMLRSGIIDGLDQVFGESGSLQSLKAQKSVTMDSEAIQKFAPEAQQLIKSLNEITPGAGDALHLGVIELDIKPKINYYSPILAYGFSKRLTIGVGLPIINYSNSVSVSNYGSNITQYSQGQTFGNIQAFSEAFAQMSGVSSQFQKTITDKGYKPLTNRDQTFMGDMIVNAQYILWGNRRSRLVSKTSLGLPTGPAYDADDLLALNNFGRTSIDQNFVYGRKFNRRLTIAGKAGLKLFMPDKIEARVPASADDLLPGLETKESLSRQLGMQATVGLYPQFKITNSVSSLVGVQHTSAQSDKYSGSRGQRYDLLSEGTEKSFTVAKMGFSYSTVKAYMKRKSFLPFIVSYEYSDTVAGTNTERQTTHDLLLTMFYK